MGIGKTLEAPEIRKLVLSNAGEAFETDQARELVFERLNAKLNDLEEQEPTYREARRVVNEMVGEAFEKIGKEFGLKLEESINTENSYTMEGAYLEGLKDGMNFMKNN